jgi:hypothetical protein
MGWRISSVLSVTLSALPVWADGPHHLWTTADDSAATIERRIPVPVGWARVPLSPDSFGAWLRSLPLRPGRPPVRLHDGRLKSRTDVHHAVVDLDVGRRDLQQCADAVIRLRAEYLWWRSTPEAIGFRFTSGEIVPFSRWAAGERPIVRGERVRWTRSAAPDGSYSSFRRYLDTVFTYAGSASLEKELLRVPRVAEVEPGDVFIEGGFPGHAVLVLDVAVETATGRKAFLLGQSYMPAQEFHVLRNAAGPDHGPWYDADFGERLVTPEWTFRADHLRRFASAPINR